jgi:hypothetical protein
MYEAAKTLHMDVYRDPNIVRAGVVGVMCVSGDCHGIVAADSERDAGHSQRATRSQVTIRLHSQDPLLTPAHPFCATL